MKKIYFMITLFCLLFSGCGKGAEENLSEETKEEASVDYADRYQKLPVNDLFLYEWKRGELTETEYFMSFADYLPNIFPKNQEGEHYNRGYCADGESIYSLDTYYSRGEDGKLNCTHYLNILDGLTREVRTITYQDESFLTQPFLIGGRFFAVSYTMDDGIIDDIFTAELLPDGTIERKTNVCEIMREEGMLPQQYFVAEVQLYYEPATDCFYLISPEEDRLFVLDAEGGLLEKQEGENTGARFFYFAATPQGRMLFLKLESGISTIFYYDRGERVILFEDKSGTEAGAVRLTVDHHGRLLFPGDGAAVVEWDPVSGTMKRIYTDTAAQNDSFGQSKTADCVMRNENGELLILKDNDLRIVTEKGPAVQVTVTVKPMVYGDWETLYRKYEATHPGVSFEILPKVQWDTRDVELAQVMQEMVEGEGPDILLIDRQQMMNFDKNHCLMDLSGLLSDATKEKLVPGVLEYGRTEDGIKLLSNQPLFGTLFVNQKYLTDSALTAREIVEIVGEKEAQGEPFEQLVRGVSHPFSIFVDGIFDSEFIDVENRECNFDSELFVRVLEICKRYKGDEDQSSGMVDYRLLKDDKVLFLALPTTNLKYYSEARAALGDEYIPVGYPSVSGNGNQLKFIRGYAVNQNTENYEVIADFLNWVFSRENETVEVLSSVPTRIDLYEGREEYDTFYNSPVIHVDSHSVIVLEGKSDGTSYAGEYLDLIKGSRYDRNRGDLSDIISIIWEEADTFFEGEKSARDAAKVIQSRVSLYLMEK